MKCLAFMCQTEASIRGYCIKDYSRKRRLGFFTRVDGTATREHIAKLRQIGWSYALIDETSGTWVSSYVTRIGAMVLPETEAKILAIPLVAPKLLQVPIVGFRRRIEALGRMGWTRQDIARLAGVSVRVVCPTPDKKAVRADVFARVRDAYEKYSSQQGPSPAASLRAKAAGYQLPIAWDYVDIDDPKSRPFQGFRSPA